MNATTLRRRARRETDPEMARRLEVIALHLDGANNTAISQATGMDRGRVRLWLARYEAEGLDGLRSQRRDQGGPELSVAQLQALVALAMTRRRFGQSLAAPVLADVATAEIGITITARQVRDELAGVGLRWRGGWKRLG